MPRPWRRRSRPRSRPRSIEIRPEWIMCVSEELGVTHEVAARQIQEHMPDWMAGPAWSVSFVGYMKQKLNGREDA
jgi:hypothetical protein